MSEGCLRRHMGGIECDLNNKDLSVWELEMLAGWCKSKHKELEDKG